jgi:hypothetical protein
MSTEIDINRVAYFVREAFFAQKKQQLRGKPYRPDSRHDNPKLWESAAAVCMSVGAAPDDFVAAFFDDCRIPGGPFPTSLGGPKAAATYKSFREASATAGLSASPSDPLGANTENAETFIREGLTRTLSYLLRTSGTAKINLVTIEVLRHHLTPAHPFIRILLGFEDELLMRLYFSKAYDQMVRMPSLADTASKMGFPMDKIIRMGKAIVEFYKDADTGKFE